MDIKYIIIILILGYTVYCILEDSIKKNVSKDEKKNISKDEKKKDTSKGVPTKEPARPTVISDSNDEMLVQRQGAGYNGEDEDLPDLNVNTEVMDAVEEIEQQSQQVEQQTDDNHISISVTVNNNSESNKPKTTKCSYCGRIVRVDEAGGVCPYCNGTL